MDYHELEKMTVIKLREEAKKFPDVKSVSGMKKDELIQLLVEKLDIVVPEKTQKKKAPRKVRSKGDLKKLIQDLRSEIEAARGEPDSQKKVDVLRRRIHLLKRRTRKTA